MFKKIFNLFGGQTKDESKDASPNKLPQEAQLYLAGIANLQNNNYPTALELFNRIIASDNYGIDAEQDAGFHYNRSIAKSNLNDFMVHLKICINRFHFLSCHMLILKFSD